MSLEITPSERLAWHLPPIFSKFVACENGRFDMSSPHIEGDEVFATDGRAIVRAPLGVINHHDRDALVASVREHQSKAGTEFPTIDALPWSASLFEGQQLPRPSATVCEYERTAIQGVADEDDMGGDGTYHEHIPCGVPVWWLSSGVALRSRYVAPLIQSGFSLHAMRDLDTRSPVYAQAVIRGDTVRALIMPMVLDHGPVRCLCVDADGAAELHPVTDDEANQWLDRIITDVKGGVTS